jgi:hypothetical protein
MRKGTTAVATPKRTATDVIEHAINENRLGEHLLYLFSCTAFFAGLAVLGYGVYSAQSLSAILGTVANVKFYPSMRLAKSIRDHNMAIRLLEIPLNNSKTAEEAAQLLRQFFEATIPKQRSAISLPKKEIAKS